METNLGVSYCSVVWVVMTYNSENSTPNTDAKFIKKNYLTEQSTFS